MYGFEEIAHNWRQHENQVPLQYTLRVIGYTHVLVIPASVIEAIVLPAMPAALLPPLLDTRARSRAPFSSTQAEGGAAGTLPADVMEFVTKNRFYNGTETMVIDMDRCTRCDDCVRACAATHNNNPRFLRHGPIHNNLMVAQACMHCTDPICMIGCPTGAIHRETFRGNVVINPDSCIGCSACASTHDNNPRFLRHGPSAGRLMVANACMHCADPVCMIGCPTGAIHRESFAGQVVINPSTCIGCKSCFTNCPYDAIRMVEARDENGELLVDQEMKPIPKATKCDLCVENHGGPSCERACPHDALKRMNLNTLEELAEWITR